MHLAATILLALAEGIVIKKESFILHLIVCVFLYLYLYCMKRLNVDLRYPVLLAGTTVFTSVYGVLISFLVLVLSPLFAHYGGNEEDLFKAIFPELKKDHLSRLNNQYLKSHSRVSISCEIQPFREIMQLGTVEQKRAVIEKILRYFQPQYADILQNGVKDENNGIRVLSATALIALSKEFLNTAEKLAMEVALDKDNFQLRLKYAMYLAYCGHTQILEEEHQEKVIQEALQHYQILASTFSQDESLSIAQATLNLLLKKPQHALDLLKPYLLKQKKMQKEINRAAFKAFYQLGLFNEMTALAEYEKKDSLDELCLLWRGNK
jgi:hypothetical protein